MGHFYTLLTYLHTIAGPSVMLLYPLYASVMAIESPSKVDDEQWLAYWILYSFLTLSEMVAQPVLEWIPIWYEMKVVFIAWLVLPPFRGAAFIYSKFVREQLRKASGNTLTSPSSISPSSNSSISPSKLKSRFMGLVTPKKGEQEAY